MVVCSGLKQRRYSASKVLFLLGFHPMAKNQILPYDQLVCEIKHTIVAKSSCGHDRAGWLQSKRSRQFFGCPIN